MIVYKHNGGTEVNSMQKKASKVVDNKEYAKKLADAIKKSDKKTIVNKTFATSTC